MEEDNLLPNDGSYFGIPLEPQDQTLERKKEKAKTLEALTVLEDIVLHFDERIADRDSLRAIKADITKDPALHQKLCEVNDLLGLALAEERQMIIDLIAVHNKSR